ncbi:MAG: hypothetical protein A2Y25_00755 [Candidatus Melainabacteria bacterium GWF2_37_15]|nr:MAG: hypothetical protein A2Y25_00755 [Candidatus Melainabacteria bacterium GWF2_37_15]
MATAEIAIIPMGTGSTSTSDFIAEADRVLLSHPEVKNKLTGMGTELECSDIDTLFEVLKEMHQKSFTKGAQRMYTVIKIDDRRDKESTLESKVTSLEKKLA